MLKQRKQRLSLNAHAAHAIGRNSKTRNPLPGAVKLQGGDFSLALNDFVVADEVVRFAQEAGRTHRGGKGRLTVRFLVGPARVQFLLLPIGAEVRDIYHATTAAGTVVKDILLPLIIPIDYIQHTIFQGVLLIKTMGRSSR